MSGHQPAAPRIAEHLGLLFPGCEVLAIEPLGPDTGATRDATSKAAGYGLPVRITIRDVRGEPHQLVWRIASANEFGHDRRADRAYGMVLAFDDFATMPDHVQAVDVGAVAKDGALVSLRQTGEFYLITSYASGTIYAEDLRRIARTATASAEDVARVDALTRYLARLHVALVDPTRYRRAIRDLVGHGEGIFGIIDGYPEAPGASPTRLRELEQRCAAWRWRLRGCEHRLTRTHGDFHPFNVVFEDGGDPHLLDASRGGAGDPADDLTAMAVNFVLFALDHHGAWQVLGPLWHRFWSQYLAERPDPELLAVAPPFFAWRALVVCNPKFYPGLNERGRDRLLGLAERALTAGELDPAWADELFR